MASKSRPPRSTPAIHAALTLAQNHTYDAVRGHALFTSMQEEAQRGMRAAQQMFEAAGGPEMLGMPAATRLSHQPFGTGLIAGKMAPLPISSFTRPGTFATTALA